MSIEGKHREVLETKRIEIVQSLNCERTLLLNYLRSHQVFDEEDCELILAEKANRARVGKLLDFLVRKGPEAYQHFLDVIQVENSSLYEALTGMKSTSMPSELMRQITGHQIKTEGVSSFQVQLLAEHLQRTYADLHNITAKYTYVVKAKRELEEKLEVAEKNLEFEKARQEEYEKRLMDKMLSNDDAEKHEILLLTECDDLHKGIADRDVYIIVLQMKLLAEKEECDKLRKKLDEVERKNETMAQELRRVSANYNHERGESRKLSECIRLQVDEIQKVEELKQHLRESQFENILLRDERDCVAEELKELKNWAEALKTRFDVIEKEKCDFLEKNEFVTNNCANLQESVRTLQRKLILHQTDAEDRKKRNELLANDSEIYRKQRDCALEARKEAILERDKVMSEKDVIENQYNELQTKRDKMNEERVTLIQDYDTLEKRHNTTLDELVRVKRGLNEKELEAEDLGRRLAEQEKKNSRNSLIVTGLVARKTDEDEENDESSGSGYEGEDGQDGEDGDDDAATAKSYPWRQRRLKSLLSSIKDRLAGAGSGDSSSQARLQMLQCLLPNLNSHPHSCPHSLLEFGGTSPTTTQTLHRQRVIRRNRGVNSDRSGSPPLQFEVKPRASTMPAYVAPGDVVEFIEDAERGTPACSESSSDLNEQPTNYFRERAKLVSKRYRSELV